MLKIFKKFEWKKSEARSLNEKITYYLDILSIVGIKEVDRDNESFLWESLNDIDDIFDDDIEPMGRSRARQPETLDWGPMSQIFLNGNRSFYVFGTPEELMKYIMAEEEG